MQDIHHVAAMAMMGIITYNPQVGKKAAVLRAYEFAEEFMRIARMRDNAKNQQELDEVNKNA